MPNASLFPNEPVRVTPAVDRGEPTIWLRRLVLLSTPDTSATPLRNIEFRRGLNIIQTPRRTAIDAGVVGHSVGKTLLTRLIRYSLGEPSYATAAERSRILTRLPDSVIIAHWSVKQKDYCVVRPLSSDRMNASHVVQTSEWTTAISPTCEPLSFDTFLSIVRMSVTNGLPELPGVQQDHMLWLKLLGAMTRDWQCGYRHHNEWRHQESDSGVTIDRPQASRLLRWLMSLIDIEELPLWFSHQELLNEKRSVAKEQSSLTQYLNATGPSLAAKLGVDSVGFPGGDLFADRWLAGIKAEIEEVEKKKQSVVDSSVLSELENGEELARDELMRIREESGRLQNHIGLLEEQLEAKHPGRPSGGFGFSIAGNCRMSECPFKSGAESSVVDPSRDEIIQSLREEIEERRLSSNRLIHKSDQLKAEYSEIRRRIRLERARVQDRLAVYDREIGRRESILEDVQHSVKASRANTRCRERLRNLELKIRESLETQSEVRAEQTKLLKQMSCIFSTILNDLFGPTATGKFVLSASGLEPQLEATLSAGGAALPAMARVIAFDLACLMSSVSGYGNHPRFLVHDSPRSNDMEDQLFENLFRVVAHAENSFGDNLPSFQYIITTTTPPPAELTEASNTFVRLTLSARTDEELLLRLRF